MELPPNPYGDFPDLYKAYNSCLDLERLELWDVYNEEINAFPIPGLSTKLSPKAVARCLGQMLLNAPSEKGRKSFANDINTSNSLEELASLAHLVLDGMNRIFCNPQGLAPVELQNNSSRPSFTPRIKRIAKAMEEPKESNYNSGIITTASSPETLISEQRMQAGPIATGDDGIACTQVTHVLSQATIKGIGDPDDANGTMKVTEKIKWAPSAVATIAGTSILKELNSEWV